MFEPKPISELDMKRGLIWANCISNVSAERVVIVSVINASNSEITLEETDNDMGTVSTSSASFFSTKTAIFNYIKKTLKSRHLK